MLTHTQYVAMSHFKFEWIINEKNGFIGIQN